MKSSKAKGRDRRNRNVPRSRLFRLVFLGLTACAVAACVLLALRERPQRLFDRASLVFHRDPSAAEALLSQSIAAAGGDFPQAQLALSRLLALQSRWSESLGCFSLISNPESCDSDQLVEIASAADNAGELLLAEMAFEAVCRQGQDRESAIRRLIPISYRLGHTERVLEHCHELAQLAPSDPLPFRVTGRIYQDGKDVFAAIAAYREGLHRTSKAEANEIRGELMPLLIQTRDLQEARREMNHLLSAPDVRKEVRLQNAHLLRLESKASDALRLIDTLLLEQPDDTAARMLRGVIKLDLGDFHGCVNDLKKVAEEQPTNIECHYKLAIAYRELRQDAPSQEHLRISQQLTEWGNAVLALEIRFSVKPDNVVCQQIAELYERLGNPLAAAEWRRRAEQIGKVGSALQG